VTKTTFPFRDRLLLWGDRFAPALTFIALIAIWEAASRFFNIPRFLLPSPSYIVTGALDQTLSTWLANIWATVKVAFMGYLVAIVVSIPLAVGLALSRFLSRTVYPLLVIIHSTPVVAIAPIIIVILGTSAVPRILITFLITFFPIVVSTTAGLLATPEELIELSRSLRATRAREVLHIRLPYALPFIFSALKISSTLAIVGAVVAEFIAAERGLGYFIQLQTSFLRINQGFAALIMLVAISLCFFQIVGVIQRIFAPWSLPKKQ